MGASNWDNASNWDDMKHLDAKAIRERLNHITLAIATLESDPEHVDRLAIAQRARKALHEIALLVTDDETEEHGGQTPPQRQKERNKIRAATALESGIVPVD